MKKPRLMIAIPLVVLLVMACNLPEVIVESIDQSLEGEEPTFTQPAASVEPGQATPAPSLQPTATLETCLVGTWEISGIHEYVLAAIPPEMSEQYQLTYTGTSGRAYFILTPDGQVRMQADDLELNFEARASIFTVPVTARVDGEAVGSYRVENSGANRGTLTTTDMDTSGLDASAQAMGQDLLTREQIFRTIPLLQPPANQAQYSCEGNTLTLNMSAYPQSVPPLVFRRK